MLKLQIDTTTDYAVSDYVNQLFETASQQNISDIHLEPMLEHCRIRLRKDGLLFEHELIKNDFAQRIITRLKVMANLNIAERRLPQDGRLQINLQTNVRLSTCPTLWGEKLVLRFLKSSFPTLSNLGFSAHQQQIFQQKLSRPQGLILVTGPTGSGKSTTLYAALQHLNSRAKNILTAEDPVEIQLPGITQVAINPKIGLDFANLLRTFMRQDPDIIMIGEIRDQATATMAMQAAQTGHLVLSTLHTNNTFDALLRLESLGVTHDQLQHSLSLIIAQRLLRKLCQICRNIRSCQQCHHGYTGRTAIYELLPIDTDLFNRHTYQPQQLRKLMNTLALPSLREAAIEKVNQGITDSAEMQRILGE